MRSLDSYAAEAATYRKLLNKLLFHDDLSIDQEREIEAVLAHNWEQINPLMKDES